MEAVIEQGFYVLILPLLSDIYADKRMLYSRTKLIAGIFSYLRKLRCFSAPVTQICMRARNSLITVILSVILDLRI